MTPKKADDYLLNDPFRISTPERLLIDKNCSKPKCTFIIHLAIIFLKNYLYPKHWAMGICILYDNNWGWNLADGRKSVHSILSSSVTNTECHILRWSVRAQRLTRHVPCIWGLTRHVPCISQLMTGKVTIVQSCSSLLRPPWTVASSVHGILQARILEWVAIPFSRGSSWPRDRTQVSCIAGRFITVQATREANIPGKRWTYFKPQKQVRQINKRRLQTECLCSPQIHILKPWSPLWCYLDVGCWGGN